VEAVTRSLRITFLCIAVVIALAAVFLFSMTGSEGGEEDEAASRSAATATPSATPEADGEATATPTPEPTATPRPQPPLVTGERVKRLRFIEGETVRFRVRSAAAEEVHVHGYDVYADVPAGRTVTVFFPARITGIFEVEFHNAGREIAQLRVDPR